MPEAMKPQPYAGQPEGFVVEAAAVAPITGKSQQSWLHRKHPSYRKNCERWSHVQDFYLGEVADESVSKKYLVRRFQGEADQAYDERCKLADFTPHLGTLIDTLAGMLWSADDRTKRSWTDEDGSGGLGRETEPGTPAHRLSNDANGYGCGWNTLWRQFTLDIIAFQSMWVLVDTVDGFPVVKLVNPQAVTNWVDGVNGPTDVLMVEDGERRQTLEDDVDKKPYWIRWKLGGWERWTEDQDGTPRMLEGGTANEAYSYQDREGRPTLPIFKVELPLRRYIAWLLSKKAASIYNQESVRDHGLRVANFSKLVLAVSSSKQYEDLFNKMVKGENVIPLAGDVKGTHNYINPSSEPTVNASTVLDKKVEHLWVSAFKMYEDAAAQVTATEVKQRVAAGIGAFLQLLGAAVDDAENGAFWRLEQAEYSESENKWGVATVKRSDDFSSIDQGIVLDQMKKRYLGDSEPIPVGRSALIKLAKNSAKTDGLPVDDAEVEAAVDAALLTKLADQLTKLDTTPPLVKARLTMKLVAALGIVDPAEEIAMSNGEKKNLLEQLTQEAEDAAMKQQQQKDLQSQLPPFGGA